MSSHDQARDRFGDKFRPVEVVPEDEKRRAGAVVAECLADWARRGLGRLRPKPRLEQKPNDDPDPEQEGEEEIPF
jgi:hypothetical protein